MPNLQSTLATLKSKYWPLTKSLQTSLLLTTGLAGYMSAHCPVLNLSTVLAVTGSLFLAISGSTVLNMWYDRDTDAKMDRTCWRPLPAGKITPHEALRLGLSLSALGIGWALAIDLLYGAIVFAGLFFDVIVYTIWLKRRTAWSIVWGGISGAMPVLAGRALGYGSLDWVGLALTASVLFWIPTHILTFSMRYYDDYKAAGIPTFPSTYGFQFTRVTIAASSVLAALAIGASVHGLSMSWGYMRLIAFLAIGLLGLAIYSTVRPSEKLNFGLFKYASLFMFGSMIMIVISAIEH
jgi:protoheme IX farnesyltransferase